jgi:hypothetical protein
MIVQLVGPPACGKRTIGAIIAKRTGAALIDNHLINDPVFTALGVNGVGSLHPQAIPMAGRVRQIVHEAVLAAPPGTSHIFTNWLVDTPEDAFAGQEIRALAAARDASFFPVWLTCAPDQIRHRLTLPDRAVRNKLRDPSRVDDILAQGIAPAPDDALRLETTDLDADTAAGEILAWVDAHH